MSSHKAAEELLAEEFNLSLWQVQNTIALIDEGNTIPFIARYRKERTGSLSDDVLRELYDRLSYLRSLEERRGEILRLIDEQGALTDEITAAAEKAVTLAELDDIYRPFRPKRRTRASIAKEKGLMPLAELILSQDGNDIEKAAAGFTGGENGVQSSDEAIQGAMDIIAEQISDNADFRGHIRKTSFETGIIRTKASKDGDSVYSLYYDYSEPAAKIAPHRVLAVNRGEKEGWLSVKLEADEEKAVKYLNRKLLSKKSSPAEKYIRLSLIHI